MRHGHGILQCTDTTIYEVIIILVYNSVLCNIGTMER